MRSGADIVHELRQTIKLIYLQPHRFGDANRVDTSLWCFHMAMAIALEREEEFRRVIVELSPGTLRIPDEFRSKHPNATDINVTDYVVKRWVAISMRLHLNDSEF